METWRLRKNKAIPRPCGLHPAIPFICMFKYNAYLGSIKLGNSIVILTIDIIIIFIIINII